MSRLLEYIDGRLVVTPGVTATTSSGSVRWPTHWKPASDEFRPDVFVYSRAEADAGSAVRFTGAPAQAVEIVSSNRRSDLVRTATEYASPGLPHYWIVDAREQTISAYALDDGVYRLTAQIGLGPGLPVEADLDFGLAALHVDARDVFGL